MSAFGIPITTDTLKQMSRYRNREITQEDRAREAMRLIHAEGKNLDALKHAIDLKGSYESGVSTLVLIYNATGDTLELVGDQKMDWSGYVYHEEPPHSFENGQWLVFLHGHPASQAVGSEAARVYRGRDIQGHVRDYLISWSIPWGPTQNSAYTEVREKDHFPQYWDYIKESLLEKTDKITRDETDQYCVSTVSIGGFTTSELIAVLSHKFEPLPEEL